MKDNRGRTPLYIAAHHYATAAKDVREIDEVVQVDLLYNLIKENPFTLLES